MSAEKLQALKKFFPRAEAFTEGGVMGAFLPGLQVDMRISGHRGRRFRLITDGISV